MRTMRCPIRSTKTKTRIANDDLQFFFTSLCLQFAFSVAAILSNLRPDFFLKLILSTLSNFRIDSCGIAGVLSVRRWPLSAFPAVFLN